jgi:hypothetical protein
MFCDAGVAFGRPHVDFDVPANIVAEAGQENVNAEEKSLQDKADKLRFYPVVKVGVTRCKPHGLSASVMNDRMFAELFGGTGRYMALRYLFEHGAEEFSARELAAAAHTDPGNTHRWLRRWEEAGLVTRGVVSDTNYRASADPALAPLTALFRQSSDLLAELRNTLATIDGVAAAVVFGSFARNEEKADSDIDVLILGDVSELKANALLRPLSRKYGRAFNATVFPVEQFRHLIKQGDGFASEVMAQPRMKLLGDLDAEVAE